MEHGHGALAVPVYLPVSGSTGGPHKSWGNKFIENLAADIKLAFTDAKGYSVRNLKYMAKFAATYASECKNTDKNRTIRISHRLNELKRKANENLCSEKGLKLRSQRVVEVEQVFGRIKGCWSFRRFHLRGTDKVKIEWGLPAIAHNITKMALEG